MTFSEECKSGIVSTLMGAMTGYSSHSPIPDISEVSSSPVQSENVAAFGKNKNKNKEPPPSTFLNQKDNFYEKNGHFLDCGVQRPPGTVRDVRTVQEGGTADSSRSSFAPIGADAGANYSGSLTPAVQEGCTADSSRSSGANAEATFRPPGTVKPIGADAGANYSGLTKPVQEGCTADSSAQWNDERNSVAPIGPKTEAIWVETAWSGELKLSEEESPADSSTEH
eukprot:GHVP01025762.1.p1 GENE.GHVP01025762.1~~GHVP01025762.1.p1  ORF type:complete len:225 (-),score=51.74 GHVP01025762.1:16-690(-)